MRKILIITLVLVSAAVITAAAWVLAFVLKDLPDTAAIQTSITLPSVRIEDRNGRLLYEAMAEKGGRNQVVPLSQIPLRLQQAMIATEDSRFYTNPGFDLAGIARASWSVVRGGEEISGGSTITQQVARNLLMSDTERTERSLRRKLREIALAWELTQRYSKDEILSLYLNQSYYGGMAYGVEAAAQTFFGKPAAELDLAESALIAGLPQSPGAYNPFEDPEAARRRQQVVLGRMQAEGYITEEERAQAEREPLAFAETPYPILAPHFVMMARSQVDRLFSAEEVARYGGMVVRTTLDLDWQQAAERAVARQLAALKTSPDGLGHNVNSAALVAIDPHNGEVRALVGSPDYFDSEHAGAINMALAPRQPGSALKPVVYAAALDPSHRKAWTAATMLLDVRTAFTTQEGEAYVPANYDQREHGPVLVRQALGSSLNIPAVLTLQHVGLPELFRLAEQMGISTLGNPDDYDLSLALGGGEVRLIDLTAAYGAFASGGYRVLPVILLEVSDPQGNTLYQSPEMEKQRVVDERVAWLISDVLSDNDARLLGFGPNSVLRLDRPAAVKTGTTSNFHDNWTVGYTPSLVVGVWAGNSDYQPMHDVTGLSGAAPIWHQFVRDVLAGQPAETFSRPPGMERATVCTLSGMLPTPECPFTRQEWFIPGTQPTQYDPFYKKVMVDQLTGLPADASTPPDRLVARIGLDLPPAAQPWARSQGLLLLNDLVGSPVVAGNGEAGIAAGSGGSPLRLVEPASGSRYRISSGLAVEAQQIKIEAVGEAGLREVTMWVDGAQVGVFAGAPYAAWWQIKEGRHTAWAEGKQADGSVVRSEVVGFEVLGP